MKPVSPNIVPRQKHRISRKRIAHSALTVLYTLKRHGCLAFLAGGSVRDMLIGRKPKDFDVATDAEPARVRKMFRRCRLIGRRFRLVHVIFPDGFIEVATFRSNTVPDEQPSPSTPECNLPGTISGAAKPDFQAREGMIVRDNQYGTPDEDAIRRDFTINALFYDIRDFSVIDYVNGLGDLRQGLIRSIGNPDIRFVEDPVRMLRAVRFAASLGFEIEEASAAAISCHHNRLSMANSHRLYDEWQKITASGALGTMGSDLLDKKLLGVLLPDFARWLESDTDGKRRRFIMACRHLDKLQQRLGSPVPADLTFAMMMGEYFENLMEGIVSTGTPWFPAAMQAVGNSMKAGNMPMSVPNSVVQNTARLMAVQNRFLPEYRGSRRRRFRNQAIFAPALEVFRLLCRTQDRPPEWLAALDEHRDDHVLVPNVNTNREDPTSSVRRRRKRRSRRSPRNKPDTAG